MDRKLCFVLMPFDVKPIGDGRVVDFNAVYTDLIQPAIEDAGFEPLRASDEQLGGIIHKAMFERLILCEFAVADLTSANPNVFYELGVRHAVRPWSTVSLFAKDARLPFDVSLLRCVPYSLDASGKVTDVDKTRPLLARMLTEAREGHRDSPVFTLIDGMREQEVDHERTDSFRTHARYNAGKKERLAKLRKEGLEPLKAFEKDLGDVANAESGVVVDLLLSYRAVRGWHEMIALEKKMSPPLRATVMVREQVALALNRAGDGEAAEAALVKLLADRGPSSETYGILGRVLKDRWEVALRSNANALQVRAILGRAIAAYVKGFETDWRDAYPGVNAVTLMELADPVDPRQAKLLPLVSYAVERKIAAGRPDYWDHATLVELDVLARRREDAESALGEALANIRESWEPETTARNLGLIREARAKRGESLGWASEVEEALRQAAGAAPPRSV